MGNVEVANNNNNNNNNNNMLLRDNETKTSNRT